MSSSRMPKTIYGRIAVFSLLLIGIIFFMTTASWAKQQGFDLGSLCLASEMSEVQKHPIWPADYNERSERRTLDQFAQKDQEKLQRHYKKWKEFSPQHKEMLRRRQERWEQMNPRERDLYRQRYQQFQQLRPKERRQIQKKLHHWEQLSPSEREQIRQRFKNSH